MNNSATELEKWLTGGELLASGGASNDNWEPGFEVDRQVVYSRMGGFYQNIFLLPDDFVKHFYHEVYPLPIDDWDYQEQITLFKGFCHIDIDLEIRFQATLKFVQRNIDYIADINKHIKQVFQNMLADIVHKEIQNLNDGAWVQNGLSEVEKTITVSINEQLMVQNVQAQTLCKLNAHFEDFPNIQPGRENVYLHALKKSYEIKEQKSRAFFHQQQALKEQKVLQKQAHIEQLKKFAELERQKRAQETEDKLILLQDQEKQLAGQLAIEKRIHAENTLHQNQLKEMEFEAELQTQQKQNAKQRITESQNLAEVLEHQAELEEKKNQADLQRRAKQQVIQTQTHQNKTLAEVERYENQQETWGEAKLRIHEQQLALKQRQKQLDDVAEQQLKLHEQKEKDYQVIMPFQKLKKFEDIDASRKKSAALRNEIELALLEKQRLDIELAIKEAQKNSVTDKS